MTSFQNHLTSDLVFDSVPPQYLSYFPVDPRMAAALQHHQQHQAQIMASPAQFMSGAYASLQQQQELAEQNRYIQRGIEHLNHLQMQLNMRQSHISSVTALALQQQNQQNAQNQQFPVYQQQIRQQPQNFGVDEHPVSKKFFATNQALPSNFIPMNIWQQQQQWNLLSQPNQTVSMPSMKSLQQSTGKSVSAFLSSPSLTSVDDSRNSQDHHQVVTLQQLPKVKKEDTTTDLTNDEVLTASPYAKAATTVASSQNFTAGIASDATLSAQELERKRKKETQNDSNYTKNLIKGFRRFMTRKLQSTKEKLDKFLQFYYNNSLSNEFIIALLDSSVYAQDFDDFLNADPMWWIKEAKIKDTEKQLKFFKVVQSKKFSQIRTKRKNRL